MRKKILLFGVAALIVFGLSDCSKNKFKLTRSQPTDIPYYNLANDTCFVCHNVSTLRKFITTSQGEEEVVPLYVNRNTFASSLHRANRCVDCHSDIVWDRVKNEHKSVPKYYGGWANFSAEDTVITRNYTTAASMACVNCHGRSSFLSSPHYLTGKIKASHSEQLNGIQIGKEYDKAKCGKCHLTCATCHFKGQRVQESPGDVTDYWNQLLRGEEVPNAEKLTNWAIDWTTNVESHDFAIAEDLEESNDLCRLCHTGYYTKYEVSGFQDSDTLVKDLVISQGIQKYPKYEEWRFLNGDIPVKTGTNFSLDSIYGEISNSEHYSRKCIECHDRIHSLTPISCLKSDCHPDKLIPAGRVHDDVGCEACHDATLKVFRVIESTFPFASTVRAAAIKDNKVIDWRSHMIVSPQRIPDFCKYKCHNAVGEGAVGARVDFEIIEIHDQDAK